ncbi:MAG TPA: indole-3-glycerol phosphate synthase TrpC [Vicinamibacterales bacterium]|jgi:indole-3-glycerol phosphate synthase
MTRDVPDLLLAILAATRRSLEIRRDRIPMAVVEAASDRCAPRGGEFTAALSRIGTWNVIAECKRRSPSRGVLRDPFDPAAIAEAYAAAGAAAISVLTEPMFFDGSLDHLAAVRARVATPVLRKDFMIDEYQLVEARAAGADAVLLIVAAIDQSRLAQLVARASSLGLSALVEVHDGHDLALALDAGARIVGVNNRDLRTLAVDLRTSESLVDRIPDDVLAIAESGLRRHEDLERLRAAGFDAFLIGEQLMTASAPGEALRALLSEPSRSEACT